MEFGPIDAVKTIETLSNQATLHVFTKYKIGQDDVSTITLQYLLYKFHSIIPDIGASGVSTAREP
jgi:hypothetical protein